MNNRTCIGFSGANSTLDTAKSKCAAEGGSLFDGGFLDAAELPKKATTFLISQNKTSGEWFWIDASYSKDETAEWSSYSGRLNSTSFPRCLRLQKNIFLF